MVATILFIMFIIFSLSCYNTTLREGLDCATTNHLVSNTSELNAKVSKLEMDYEKLSGMNGPIQVNKELIEKINKKLDDYEKKSKDAKKNADKQKENLEKQYQDA